MNRAEIKEKAKTSLKGKYGDAISLLFVYLGISFAGGVILVFLGLDETSMELASNIVAIIISALFEFGMLSYFLKISRNEAVSYKELFSKTNLFWPYIAISLLTSIFIILWSFLFIIPGIIASISYSLVYYIKLDNPELSASEVISKSKEMMSGHKWDFFVLGLSFIGWAILGIFTFGILYLWLVPYMQVTYANFYNSLK